MKNKRRAAIILYAVYAVFITLLILVGNSLAGKIITRIETKLLNEKSITDVTVDISADTELLAGRDYYPVYTAHGSYRGSPGLVFTSLDPDYLAVSDKGAIRANTGFDGDYIDARVRVTSSHNSTFEKILTFRFVKKYPDSFSVSYFVQGYGKNAEKLSMGVPVYVFVEINSGSQYNMTDYTLVYDEECFDRLDDGALVLKRMPMGDEPLYFAIEYANGARAESAPITPTDQPLPTEFDEIRLNGIPADEYVGKKNDNIELTLWLDGERLATDYTITLEKTGDAKKDGKGGMRFLTVGDKGMTVTLPSGFSKTVHFSIENTLALPVVKDETVSGTHVIDLLTTDAATFTFDFGGAVSYDKVTYEYDAEMLEVTSSERTFTLKPKAKGETTVKVIVDDGYKRLEDVYTVRIKKDFRLVSIVYEDISIFVTKVLGHGMCFVVLAFFSLNMFRYLTLDKKLIRFILYTLTALPIAAFTEAVQVYIPDRDGRLRDVFIDMLSFYIGTLIALAVIYAVRYIPLLISLIRKRLKKRQDN